MERNEIMKYVDHTLLLQGATWDDIKGICDDALKYGTASVCIPPSYVKRAAEYLDGRMAVCTVIGFPNGYNTTAVKCAETADAIANGADEIDMVINIGELKAKNYDYLLGEIKAVDTYPASKIYTVKGKKEYLIPAVKDAFIRSIDLDANRMEVHVWEGLATDEH